MFKLLRMIINRNKAKSINDKIAEDIITKRQNLNAYYHQQAPISISKITKTFKQDLFDIENRNPIILRELNHRIYQAEAMILNMQQMPHPFSPLPNVNNKTLINITLMNANYNPNKAEDIDIMHLDNNTDPVVRMDVAAIILNLLKQCKKKIKQANIYYLANKVRTSQENEHKMDMNANQYTPVTTTSFFLGEFLQPSSFKEGVKLLATTAVKKHCDAVYNIHTINHTADYLAHRSVSRKEMCGDLIRFKNHPLINTKKYGKHYLYSTQLLSDLEHDSQLS